MIYDPKQLKEVTSFNKEQGLIVGLCHGCFDLLHIGHIRHLNAARDRCNILFVSITSDDFVKKGRDRPLIPDIERAELVGNLKSVSGALINYHPTAVKL